MFIDTIKYLLIFIIGIYVDSKVNREPIERCYMIQLKENLELKNEISNLEFRIKNLRYSNNYLAEKVNKYEKMLDISQ